MPGATCSMKEDIYVTVETRDDCDCECCTDDETFCWTVSSYQGEAFSDAVGGSIDGSSAEVSEDDYAYVILTGTSARELARELKDAESCVEDEVGSFFVHWEGYFYGSYGGEGSDLDNVLQQEED